MSVVVVRWECVKSPHLVISKDCGKGGRPDSFIVRSSMLSIRPSFPPPGAPRFLLCSRARRVTRTLLVSALGAVGHHLGHVLDVLLRLHPCESMAQPLVLDDGCVANALVRA